MGIVDWDNNGIEPHEVGITAAVVGTLLNEADRAEVEAAELDAEQAAESPGDGPAVSSSDEPGVSCGCIVAILAFPAIYLFLSSMVESLGF